MRRNFLLLAVLFAGTSVLAQTQFTPPPNKNAALRYWMAFADLRDRTIDQPTTKLMEDVLAGNANWDEQRLGPVVQDNRDAVLGMQRASELPECNWGLE